jgi:hypothetical protein
MDAYWRIANYDSDFDSKTFASSVKNEGSSNFDGLNRRNDITLGADSALYLYGGRKALLTKLKPIDPRIIGQNWEQLVVLHSKVPAGQKTKRILMITHSSKSHLDAIANAKEKELGRSDSYWMRTICEFIEKLPA